MTATTSHNKSLQELKQDHQRMVNRANTYKIAKDMTNANAFFSIAEKIQSLIDEMEKKNEQTPSEQPPANNNADSEVRTKPNTMDNLIKPLDIPVSPNLSNTEGGDLEEKYKFTSLEGFLEFKELKDRLRTYLKNWLNKKNKQPFDYEEMALKVGYVLQRIDGVIAAKGRSEYLSLIRSTTYSIGDKKLCAELGKEEIRFGFDLKQLKEDFNF